MIEYEPPLVENLGPYYTKSVSAFHLSCCSAAEAASGDSQPAPAGFVGAGRLKDRSHRRFLAERLTAIPKTG
ncbi:hypothetical protein LM602_04745 [Candidatus Acetothermia bacterium]|nr:hypothetical protein [Candidatus Acetothermia bacterium]MCI2431851.1 hypothetical protein [Candidatus Acetothermia bacterium]MCI2435982.1 hypothetical protein [Candidatus Acetothermia bacterium]